MTYRDDPVGHIVTWLLVAVAVSCLLAAIGLQNGPFIVGALLGLAVAVLIVVGHGRAKPESDGWW